MSAQIQMLALHLSHGLTISFDLSLYALTVSQLSALAKAFNDVKNPFKALMCSSHWYAGRPDLVGKECMRFDGTNYGMIWYTNFNHYDGAMTNFNYIRTCGNVPFNIGGGDYKEGLFYFECWIGEEWEGPWQTVASSDDPLLVGLRGFTAISVPYKLR